MKIELRKTPVKLEITIEVVTNVNISSEQIADILREAIFDPHPEEVVLNIPRVRIIYP